MPLMPKRTKFRKMQKGRNRGKATRGNVVNEGEFGLQTLEAGLITANQIEACVRSMVRVHLSPPPAWGVAEWCKDNLRL